MSTARIFRLISPHVFNCMFLFDHLVGGEFLILRGWCAVGLKLEGVGWVAFSLVPWGIKGRGWGFSLPKLAFHAVFVPSS